MKSHALIVGGAGNWGAKVAEALASKGWPVLSVDHLKTGSQERLRFGPLLKADATETSRIERAISEYQVRHLFHCALAEESSTMELLERHFRTVMSLLQAARGKGVKSLTIFSGSAKTNEMLERILEDCAKVMTCQVQLVPAAPDQVALAKGLRFIETPRD